MAEQMMVDVGANTSGFSRAFNSLPGITSGPLKAVAIGIAGVTAALTAVGIAGVKKFSQFSEEVAKFGTMLTEVERKQLPGLSKGIRKASIEFAQSTSDLNQGMFDVISSGFRGKKAMDVLRASSKLAVGGAAELAGSTSAVISLMKTYGDELDTASDAADFFFRTQLQARSSVDEMAAAFPRMLPRAHAAGVELEHLAAMFSVVTLGGKSTSEAVTGLDAMLLSLSAPTKEVAERFKQFGVVTKDANKNLLDIRDIVGQMSHLDLEQLRRIIPEKEALDAFIILRDNIKQFPDMLAGMGKGAKSAQEAMDEMAQESAFLGRQLKQKVNVALSTLGEKLMPDVITGMKFLSSVLDENKDSIIGFVVAMKNVVGGTIEWIVKHAELLKTVGTITAIVAATTAVVKLEAAMISLIRIQAAKAFLAWGKSFGFFSVKTVGVTKIVSALTVSARGLLVSIKGLVAAAAIPALALAAAAAAIKMALMVREMNKLQEQARDIEARSIAETFDGIRDSAQNFVEAGGNMAKMGERIAKTFAEAGVVVKGDFGDKMEAALAIDTIRSKFGEDATLIIDAAKKMGTDGAVSFDRLNAAVQLLPQLQEKAKEALESLKEPIKELAPVTEAATKALAEFFAFGEDAPKAAAQSMENEFLNSFLVTQDNAEKLVRDIGETFSGIAEAGEAVGPKLAEAMSRALLEARAVLESGMGEEGRGIFEDLMGVTPEAFEKMKETLAEKTPELMESMFETIEDLPEEQKNLIMRALGTTPEQLDAMVVDTGDKMKLMTGMITTFGAAVRKSATAFSALGIKGGTPFGKVMEKMAAVQDLISLAQAVWQIARAAAEAAGQNYPKAAMHVAAASAYMTSAAAGKKAKAAIKAADTAGGAALGGVISGPPGVDKVPIMTTAGEGVLTPSTVKGILSDLTGQAAAPAAGGGGDTNFFITVEGDSLDNDGLVAKITPALEKAMGERTLDLQGALAR